MPRPLELTNADLLAGELTGASLSGATGALDRLGNQNMFGLAQQDLFMRQHDLEKQRKAMARARARQPLSDLLALGVGGLTLGLGGSGTLAALAGGAAGSMTGEAPHPLIGGGLSAASGIADEMEASAARRARAARLAGEAR